MNVEKLKFEKIEIFYFSLVAIFSSIIGFFIHKNLYLIKPLLEKDFIKIGKFYFDAFFIGFFAISLVFLPFIIGFARKKKILYLILSLIFSFYFFLLSESKFSPSWDFYCYYAAAKGMLAKINIYKLSEVTKFNKSIGLPPTNYLYTPLLATLLSYSKFLNLRDTFYFFHLANFWIIIFVFIILINFFTKLMKSNIDRKFLFFLFFLLTLNPPFIQTFLYNQINIITFFFMLLSLYFYEKNFIISALFMAIATHLKLSPFIFIFLFFVLKDYKWILFYMIFNLIIFLFIGVLWGFEYWSYFIQKLMENPTFLLRNNSIDSFFFNSFKLFGINNIGKIKFCILFTKIILWIIIFTLVIVKYWIKKVKVNYIELSVLFFFLMIFFSPYVWWHHYVFWTLIYIFLYLKRKYSLLFITLIIFNFLPFIEIYPFSYVKLLSMFLIYVIIVYKIIKEGYILYEEF